MELETAVQVSTNQMKRQEEENKRLQESLDTAEATIRTMQSQLGEHKRKYTDLESQVSVKQSIFIILWETFSDNELLIKVSISMQRIW